MRVIILGSDGFVGKNLLEDLSTGFDCYGSTRREDKIVADAHRIYFDLQDPASWNLLIELQPDCIINCIVSGTIQKEEDVKSAIDINYLQTTKFYQYISIHLPGVYLIHLGTAFEYDLDLEALTEESACYPKTYYGISKLLASNFLLAGKFIHDFTIIRPFNIFGPYDKQDKIIPYLITSQKEKKAIPLSEGLQKRDYFFVKDLSVLVKNLVSKPSVRSKIINAGSGRPMGLKEVAQSVSNYIPHFDASLWQWGKLAYREGESNSFYNNSAKLKESGTVLTNFEKSIEATVAYYFRLEKKILLNKV